MLAATRAFCPILRAPGPDGGWIAFAFEGTAHQLTLETCDTPFLREAHAGQRAIDAVLDRHGVAQTVRVTTDLPAALWHHPAWEIPLAACALCQLRDTVTGLSEGLYFDDMQSILQHIGILPGERYAHCLRAALEGGVHVRVDPRGEHIGLRMPEAALVWLRVDAPVPRKAWKQAQTETHGLKRVHGYAERIAGTLLRAACDDGLAIFETLAAIDVPQQVLAATVGWLPAAHAIARLPTRTFFALEGAGPDMLIAAYQEVDAERAAIAAQNAFRAHAISCTLHAWSTLEVHI